MWNTRRDERDSGGPVLRDPLASRLSCRSQPYPFNSQNREQNNHESFGGHSGQHHQNYRDVGPGNEERQLFPPAHTDTFFPPTPPPPFFQQAPTPPPVQQQAPLLSLLGLPSGLTPQIDASRSQEPPVPIFPGRGVQPPFGDNLGNNSFNFQPPSQILAPPLPSLLATPPMLSFQNQGHQSYSGASDHSNTNSFEERQTLNLQPQWSLQNDHDHASGDQVRRSSLQDFNPGGNSQQLGFDRRPFNQKHQQFNNTTSKQNNFSPNNNAGQSYDRRPNFERRPSQQPMKPQTLDLQPVQPQRLIPSLFDTEVASNSNYGHSRTSSNLSFPSTHNQNSQENPRYFETYNKQQPIPSLFNRNASANNNNRMLGNNNKGPGQNFKQQFQKKRPPPTSGTSSSYENGNNINLTPGKPQSGPLLPTPKLIPYPPPPLNPNSSDRPTAALLRNPRGILKNSTSSGSDYSNFVRASNKLSSSNEDSPSPVVPYAVGDDDDEDDIEFMTEVRNSEGASSSMTHDFFSEKMVQHFASILNEKPLEEQLDGLLKHLVLPADFLATRVSIVRNLHVMLSDTFKKCVLQPYGADFIGVGNSDDSVNVFVDLTGKQGPSSQIDSRVIEPSEISKENMEQLLDLIQEDKNHKFFGQIVRRTNFSCNRVNLPVISFIHTETKVRCNIRLDNYLLVQEAKLIQFVCSLDPRIPSLLALARYWSSVHKVLDTPEEDTKNRFLTLLILFFLARKKIIPTMAHLQSLSVKREYFNNLDIGFCDDYSLVPQNDNPVLEDKTVFTLSTLSLLKEFFNLFATAKLKNEVVSLWKAEFIPKENFSIELEGKVLSPDLRKRYRYGVNGKLRSTRIDCGSKLCIQDFQDLAENLTLSVAEYDVSKFQIECESAYKKLEGIMSSGSGNLMDLFVVSEYAS